MLVTMHLKKLLVWIGILINLHKQLDNLIHQLPQHQLPQHQLPQHQLPQHQQDLMLVMCLICQG